MLLHELGHVDADQRLFGVEHELGQRLAQLGLADAGRAQEHERAAGAGCGSDSPARERRIASATALTASSWPTTRLPSTSSMRSSFSRSPSSMRETGMPVHFETISAISTSVTELRSSWFGLLFDLERLGEPLLEIGDPAVLQLRHAREILRAPRRVEVRACALELFLDVRRALHRGLLGLPDLLEIRIFLLQAPRARPRACARRLREASSVSFLSASRSILSWMMRRSSLSSASGLESISMRISEPASSIRSIALSGSCRSAM